MALLEAMQNYDDLFNIMVYQTLNATNSQYTCNNIGIIDSSCIPEKPQNLNGEPSSATLQQSPCQTRARANQRGNLGVQGKKKKRRRRPKVCKNREDAETQRMTHIAVERNRRKQMNEHLAVLQSLMPESYSQRGNQASIVGGAIEFVKELEHLVHSLEAQKLLISQRSEAPDNCSSITTPNTTLLAPHFPDVFSDHQHRVTQNNGSKFTLKSQAPLADVEVTLIETHANLRILSKKNPRQLSKLVSGFQAFRLSILHLNVTTLDPLVLYSISVKVEEGCLLNSVDSIAEAVHHMLRIIEEDVSSLWLTY